MRRFKFQITTLFLAFLLTSCGDGILGNYNLLEMPADYIVVDSSYGYVADLLTVDDDSGQAIVFLPSHGLPTAINLLTGQYALLGGGRLSWDASGCTGNVYYCTDTTGIKATAVNILVVNNSSGSNVPYKTLYEYEPNAPTILSWNNAYASCVEGSISFGVGECLKVVQVANVPDFSGRVPLSVVSGRSYYSL